MIKHIWFDFSETIATMDQEKHDSLLYNSFAKVKNKPIDSELVNEFKTLKQEHRSNSGVFFALGKPAGFWSQMVATLDPRTSYKLIDPNSTNIFKELQKIIPISIFSNLDVARILSALGVDPKLFSNILSGSMVGKPKPALDGFYKIIELSKLNPEEILYIGDDFIKDILPAKALGMKTGLIFTSQSEANYSFKDYNDILEFVKNNNS